LDSLNKPIGKDWIPFMCGVTNVSYTSAGMTLSPMTNFFAAMAYLKSHSILLLTNKDSVSLATLPESHTPYQPIRSFESAKRREMASGHRRNGDLLVVGHPPPGITRSAATRMSRRPRPCSWWRIAFWQTIAMAGGFSWTLHVKMMMMMMMYILHTCTTYVVRLN